VIVTHDNRILKAADRIINIVDGRVLSNVLLIESVAICEFLSQIPAFQSLTPSQLTGVADKMTLERHYTNRTIIRQGDEGDKFYLIREGAVDIFNEDDEGKKFVCTLREGDFFGEVALLTNQPRNATVIAKEDVILYTLSKDHFKATLEASASFAEQLRQIFFQRQ